LLGRMNNGKPGMDRGHWKNKVRGQVVGVA